MTPGRAEAGVDGAEIVWLVLRAAKSRFQKEVNLELRRWASDRQAAVRVRTLRAEERRLTLAGDGRRRIDILNPVDAHELYQRINAVRGCVLSQGSVYVLKDPRRDPSSRRDCLRLAEYVCHKANFQVLEDGHSPSEAAERMLSAPPSDCDALHDPRILPLHVFDSNTHSSQLRTPAGRDRFRRDHEKRGGLWSSPSTATWTQADARAWHGGRVELRVGDYLLPGGFHWDVAAPRRSVITVMNARSVWKLERSGYVNIYPDAYIRTGLQAHEVWSAHR